MSAVFLFCFCSLSYSGFLGLKAKRFIPETSKPAANSVDAENDERDKCGKEALSNFFLTKQLKDYEHQTSQPPILARIT